MLKIAICDDDKKIVDEIEATIQTECKKQSICVSVDKFYDGKDLLCSFVNSSKYQIIFLDIEMNELDGVSTAKRIKSHDCNVIIIFISGYENHLKELFEVEPFRFISKPINKEQLIKYYSDAVIRLRENNDYFQYSFNKEMVKIPINKIVYFESKNRTITVFLNDGSTALFYKKMNELEKELSLCKQKFIRIHQSFFVNYNYVTKINQSFITIRFCNSDYKLKISEDRQKNVRDFVIQQTEEALFY